ncbi:hypothetical protein [Fodinicurvata sp. EGI_FJ10296]|uniref:hypothetical protein n=1 Tax=Fodinicurvata sp. EGI_FJ10296 TaxID=3231908 RepID=UPI0034572708
MRVSQKLGMYAGVSAAALGLALIAVPASAFDEVNWTWNAAIDETVTKTVDINVDLNPTGMTMLEDLQVSIGDHTATSSVNDIFNNQPSAGVDNNGEATVDFNWTTEVDDLAAGQVSSTTILDSADDVIFLDEAGNEIDPLELTCQGTAECDDSGVFSIVVEVDGEFIELDSLDAATELPEVISAATAVANNTAIETDTSVQLHEGQFAFGGGNGDSGDFNGFNGVDGDPDGMNSNLVAASTLGAAAILGILDQAEINADSQVGNIHNASVDSSATAVVNNLTVDVAAEGDDRLLIGDAVQFSYANTNAMSDVSGVYLNNYTNLGEIDRAITNSVATAVGNNKSITVSAPVIE